MRLKPRLEGFREQSAGGQEAACSNESDLIVPVSTEIREGKTTPSKHYTEDTLLSAMETADVKVMPEEAERKGLGTPATRAAILEKLVETGFVERLKSRSRTESPRFLKSSVIPLRREPPKRQCIRARKWRFDDGFPKDELSPILIYNTGDREGTVREITTMQTYLEDDEKELAVSVLRKLDGISDEEFDLLDMYSASTIEDLLIFLRKN